MVTLDRGAILYLASRPDRIARTQPEQPGRLPSGGRSLGDHDVADVRCKNGARFAGRRAALHAVTFGSIPRCMVGRLALALRWRTRTSRLDQRNTDQKRGNDVVGLGGILAAWIAGRQNELMISRHLSHGLLPSRGRAGIITDRRTGPREQLVTWSPFVSVGQISYGGYTYGISSLSVLELAGFEGIRTFPLACCRHFLLAVILGVWKDRFSS